MAFNRLMLISESVDSTGSSSSANPFFSSDSSGSPKFFIGGDMSDDECDDGSLDTKEEAIDGMVAIPPRSQHGGDLVKLSPPSSKLAQRRALRYNSVSVSPPSSPSL